MSLISIPNIFTVGATIVASQHNSNFSVIYSDFNGNITNDNLSASAAIADTKLAQITTAGKVSGAALTSASSMPSGAGVFPTANLGSGTPTNGTALINGVWGYFPYIKCTNTQSSGVAGGTATTGSFQTMILNTKDNDTGSLATLSTNTVSLPAGTYKVYAFCNFRGTDFTQTRLYNSTDSAVLINGTSVKPASASGLIDSSVIIGIFTISGTKTVIYQYYASSTSSSSDLGQPSSAGTEIYAVIEFTKVG